jgi:hypothetical protein
MYRSRYRRHKRWRGERVPETHRGRRMSKESGLILGHLVALVLRKGNREFHVSASKLRGWFVGWVPTASKDFVLVRAIRGGARPGPLSAKAVKVFRQFHGHAPRQATVYDRPDPVGGLHEAALIKSLTYVVPEWIHSPEKRGVKWVHAFGDHGEEGHGPVDTRGEKVYPTKLMPMLLEDRAGNIYVKRRPGNRYDVTKWIYW